MVSKERDEYINDAFNKRDAIWIVKLSNGEYIYQDDNRPGIQPNSAWVRLKQYCEKNNLKIVSFDIEFRSNKIEFPRNADGYFFSRAIGAWLGESSNEQFAVGVIDKNQVHIQYFQIPELYLIREDKRDINKCRENIIC